MARSSWARLRNMACISCRKSSMDGDWGSAPWGVDAVELLRDLECSCVGDSDGLQDRPGLTCGNCDATDGCCFLGVLLGEDIPWQR
jgi:hypothetical protein